MDRILAIADGPIDSSLFAVVVIGQPEPGQRHIGILHRTANSEPSLLHLAWHCILRNDLGIPDYMRLWVALAVEPERLRVFAAFCRRVWRKNEAGGIPYAFSHPAESFDASTGALLLTPTQFGLTCASFVLAVFDAAGLRLVEYETWEKDRSGDRDWQQKIIAKLEGRASQEHIEHLRSEIGAVRYRPEEVAVATAIAPPAAKFAATVALGEDLVARLTSLAARLPASAPSETSE
jgi:hypothetical protein